MRRIQRPRPFADPVLVASCDGGSAQAAPNEATRARSPWHHALVDSFVSLKDRRSATNLAMSLAKWGTVNTATGPSAARTFRLQASTLIWPCQRALSASACVSPDWEPQWLTRSHGPCDPRPMRKSLVPSGSGRLSPGPGLVRARAGTPHGSGKVDAAGVCTAGASSASASGPWSVLFSWVAGRHGAYGRGHCHPGRDSGPRPPMPPLAGGPQEQFHCFDAFTGSGSDSPYSDEYSQI